MSDEQVPLADVLGGMTISPLEPGDNPLEAFVLIKYLDGDGDAMWAFRTTNSLNLEELLGALTVQAELLKQKLVNGWED